MPPKKTSQPLTVEQKAALKRRAQTDLFFLAKTILGYKDMTEKVHGQMCANYVQKDPSKGIFEQSEIKTRLILAPRGCFKALALDTQIPTPDGFKTMEELQVGDKVLSDEGLPCNVTGVSPIYQSHTCYEVEFSTGEVIVADAGHLWETDTRQDRDNNKGRKSPLDSCASVKTTEAIAQTLMCRNEHNHRVKVAQPIDLPTVKLPISPYVLGCWLGDGTSSCGTFTCADDQIIEEIRFEGEPITFAPSQTNQYRWVFNGGPGHATYRKQGTSLAARLRALGVLNNKHIPMQYLRASYGQRLALLQGLMDTDGTVSGGSPVFSNTNLTLCEHVKELASSLGFKPTVCGPYDSKIDGVKVGVFYHVRFQAYQDTEVFRLSGKQAKLHDRKSVSLQNFRQIVRVEEVPSVPVKCIMVDSPNHLYLATSSFIPTHNTSIDVADIIQWILVFPNIRILLLTGTQELAFRMVREVKAAFQSNKMIRDLFPDLCPPPDKAWGSNDEFTSPGRTEYRREPTLSSSTIASVKAGGHYEVIAPDDVQNEINSSSPEQCGKVIEAYDDLTYLLEPGGFVNVNGTRYQPWDLYGKMLQRYEAALKDAEEAVANGDDEAIVPELQYLIQAAWTVKPGVVLPVNEQNVPIVTKNDVDLLFPERLKFRGLLKQYNANPTKFACQMLNDPLAAQSAQRPFTEALIKKHVLPYNNLPLPGQGKTFLLWDLAGARPAADGSSDFVVGVAGRVDGFGRLYIVETRRGHWTAIQQAAQIVALQKDYPDAECTYIEDALGSRFLEPTINNIARAQGVPIWIKWITPLRKGGAKRIRIDSLALLFKADRLWLASHLAHLDQLIAELLDMNPEHDDISDAIGTLALELKISSVADTAPVSTAASRKELRKQAFEAAIFGDDDEPAPTSEPKTSYRSGLLGFGLNSL